MKKIAIQLSEAQEKELASLAGEDEEIDLWRNKEKCELEIIIYYKRRKKKN